jgi:hypothetical protein
VSFRNEYGPAKGSYLRSNKGIIPLVQRHTALRTLINPNSNHAQELHQLQGPSTAGSPAPVLRWMPVRLVLFQGLSEGRLEEAAQANLQACQRGTWQYAGVRYFPYDAIHRYEGRNRRRKTSSR